MPISSSDPTRPCNSAIPSVGSVIRERILSNVLLPAPFGPITPTISPRATSKDTSSRAQTKRSSRSSLARKGARTIRECVPEHAVALAPADPVALAQPLRTIARSPSPVTPAMIRMPREGALLSCCGQSERMFSSRRVEARGAGLQAHRRDRRDSRRSAKSKCRWKLRKKPWGDSHFSQRRLQSC